MFSSVYVTTHVVRLKLFRLKAETLITFSLEYSPVSYCAVACSWTSLMEMATSGQIVQHIAQKIQSSGRA